eukprot:UN24940
MSEKMSMQPGYPASFLTEDNNNNLNRPPHTTSPPSPYNIPFPGYNNESNSNNTRNNNHKNNNNESRPKRRPPPGYVYPFESQQRSPNNHRGNTRSRGGRSRGSTRGRGRESTRRPPLPQGPYNDHVQQFSGRDKQQSNNNFGIMNRGRGMNRGQGRYMGTRARGGRFDGPQIQIIMFGYLVVVLENPYPLLHQFNMFHT